MLDTINVYVFNYDREFTIKEFTDEKNLCVVRFLSLCVVVGIENIFMGFFDRNLLRILLKQQYKMFNLAVYIMVIRNQY